jgi:hypothetical protein
VIPDARGHSVSRGYHVAKAHAYPAKSSAPAPHNAH